MDPSLRFGIPEKASAGRSALSDSCKKTMVLRLDDGAHGYALLDAGEAAMEGTGKRVALVGMSRIFMEITASALSVHGWSVLDPHQAHLNTARDSEIVVVACPFVTSEVIGCIRKAQADFPEGKIILLGAEPNDTDLLRFIEEGARAFVPANKGLAELVSVLEMVRKNETPCSGGIARLVIENIHRLSQEHNSRTENPLTRREKEILELIRHGLSNKEIATQLHITPNTVKNHVHHLLEKLKVRSRHHAAWMQIRRPTWAGSLAAVAGNRMNGQA
jgi:DNA-binding NarL/FixJ family response regulator